jgi:hypothetical protein
LRFYADHHDCWLGSTSVDLGCAHDYEKRDRLHPDLNGIKGLIKAGGSARHVAVDNLLNGLGARLEAFYFAFGENNAYLILDVPDGRAAAAISMAVAASGACRKPRPSTWA